MMQQQIDDRRVPEGSQSSRTATDRNPNNGKDPRSNHRADAKSSQRNRPQRLFQRVFRSLRFRDQFVDRLGSKDLPGQRARSCLLKNWCGAFQLHLRARSAAIDTAALQLSKIDYRLLWPREAFLILALFAPRAPVRGPFGAAFFRAARLTFLRSCLSVMLLVFAMVIANLSLNAIF